MVLELQGAIHPFLKPVVQSIAAARLVQSLSPAVLIAGRVAWRKKPADTLIDVTLSGTNANARGTL